MKRAFLLFITLLMLFSMTACTIPGLEDPTEPPTEAPTNPPSRPKPTVVSKVTDPLTWEDIDAIPIANSSMTEDELRQIIVQFMELQNSFTWQPTSTLEYYSQTKYMCLTSNIVYGGCPYISGKMGSLYNIMHFYDEKTGLLDVEKLTSSKQNWEEIIANVCSSSPYWALSRVSNSVKYAWSSSTVQAYGCIPIAPFVMDPTIINFDKNHDNVVTYDICMSQENGEQTVFEAYAQLLPGDGLTYYYAPDSHGHVIMCSSKAVVVRNQDGTIDPKKSYITYLDQTLSCDSASHFYPQDPDNGEKVHTYGSVHRKATFDWLLNHTIGGQKQGYIPWRIPELYTDANGNKMAEVEKAELNVSFSGTSATLMQLRRMTIESNYPISYVQCVVKDPNGNELFREYVYAMSLNKYEMAGVEGAVIDTAAMGALANGENIAEISVRVSTGELLTAFSGKFMPAK